MLKKHHIKSRLECAKTNLQYDKDFFKKNCGLTKAKVNFFDHNDATHVWREDEVAYGQRNTIPKVEHGGGNIMVWGRFAYSGT